MKKAALSFLIPLQLLFLAVPVFAVVGEGTGSQDSRVSCDSMHGKVLCGYQGWFTAKGDGSGADWFH